MQNLGIVVYSKGNNIRNLKGCLKSLIDFKDNTIVVIDGEKPSLEELDNFNCKNFKRVIYESGCINYGLRQLVKNENIEHFFIVYDNILILDNKVFDDYINVNKQTNIGCFVSSSPDDGKTRLTIELKDSYKLKLTYNFNGDIVYINKNTLLKTGFLDERYKSAYEKVDYFKRCSDNGLTTPIGWFVDVENVYENILYQGNRPSFIHEVFNSNTVEDRLVRGMKLFHLKFKSELKDLINTFSQKDVISKLKLLSSRTS